MSETPKLTICVPSRNRQFCFEQTIRDLIRSTRSDIEFVFADNSDDASIMNNFMAGIADPRIRYLPSADRTLSMMDNWERTVAVATGEWVCVIGDDDYVDPDVVEIIGRIEQRAEKVDAIAWNRTAVTWGDEPRGETQTATFSMANRVVRSPHHAMMDRLFGWLGATHVVHCPYGIYHGAVHRDAILRVKTQYSNRCFEHPVVDYDFCHKLLTSSTNLIFIDRPMSVLGVCKKSNSAAVGNAKASEAARAAYLKENGDVFDVAGIEAGFPFTPETGVATSIMQAQQWFKRKYGFRFENWEGNFILGMASECRLFRDRQEFERHVEVCRAAFMAWEGGRYLQYFKPVYAGPQDDLCFFGVNGRDLTINLEIADFVTPAQFYAIAQQILPDPATLELEF